MFSRAYYPLHVSRCSWRLHLIATLSHSYMTLNINIYVFNEVSKVKFICQPCVPHVACPAALCDSCLLFVCLWPVHQLNSYDFQRPEIRTAREERSMHHLASTPENLGAKHRKLFRTRRIFGFLVRSESYSRHYSPISINSHLSTAGKYFHPGREICSYFKPPNNGQ